MSGKHFLWCFIGIAAGLYAWQSRTEIRKSLQDRPQASPTSPPSPPIEPSTQLMNVEATPPPKRKVIDFLRSSRGLFQMGNYEGSVKLLREEQQKSPENEEIRKDLGTALFALALLKIKTLEFIDAENLLEESVKFGYQDSQMTLASLKLRQGEADAAALILEDIVARTKDVETISTLIDLALSRDNLTLATDGIDKLEAQLQETKRPDTDERWLFLRERQNRLQLKQAFQKNADVIERGAISVSFSFSPTAKRLAEIVADAIEAAIASSSQNLLGPLPQGSRIRAVLFPADKFGAATGAPPWAGAIFDGIMRLPSPSGETSQIVLPFLRKMVRHESLHAYLYAFCGDELPSWIGEGLAQVAEGRNPSQARNSLQMKFGSKLEEQPAPAALDLPFMNAETSLIPELYARSLLLVTTLGSHSDNAFWATFLQKTCIDHDPVENVLKEMTGFSSAVTLWKNLPVLGKPNRH